MYDGGDSGAGVVDGDLRGRTAPAIAQLEDPVGDSSADDQDRRHTDELGVLERDAG